MKCLYFIHNCSHCYKCSSFFSDELKVEFFWFRPERHNVYSINQLARNSRKSTSFHSNSNLALNSALILVSAQCFHHFNQHKQLQRTKYVMTPFSAIHRTRLPRPNRHKRRSCHSDALLFYLALELPVKFKILQAWNARKTIRFF